MVLRAVSMFHAVITEPPTPLPGSPFPHIARDMALLLCRPSHSSRDKARTRTSFAFSHQRSVPAHIILREESLVLRSRLITNADRTLSSLGCQYEERHSLGDPHFKKCTESDCCACVLSNEACLSTGTSTRASDLLHFNIISRHA